MKLATWNVNGIRSVLNKGALQEYVLESNPDILCLQETKAQQEQVELGMEFSEYDVYFNSAVKKGYSGTAIFTKVKPLSVTYGIGIEEHDQEGRVITAEFEQFYLVTVYTPNAKRDLSRLAYRQVWEDDFLAYIKKLEETKPVIFCGDLNVAHKEIDLANPKTNVNNAGFTKEERAKFDQVVSNGLVDAFRYLHPDTVGAYSWWSYEALAPLLKEVDIRSDVTGSDHCPVEIEVKL